MNPAASSYLNRELSWLEFNQRVLDEAYDEAVPALERLKFLAITASNLDEFFMVRVGGLQQLAKQMSARTDPTGMTAPQQLDAITERTRKMVADQYKCLLDHLEPLLNAAGIERLTSGEYSERHKNAIESLVKTELLAVLSPIAVDPAGEFPLLMNRTLNVCVRLAPPADSTTARYAVIPLLGELQRFVTLPADGTYSYSLLEEAITACINLFFPGETVLECSTFRINRNADMSIREDSAEDLLVGMQEILDARKLSACVRLEIEGDVSSEMLEFLQEALEVGDDQTYKMRGPIDLASFMQLANLPGFDELKYPPWPPQPSTEVDLRESMFEVLSRRDVLLSHPYESFEPVVRLIQQAAEDPDVLAIKQTLYRTSHDSPIVAALARAAENGKNVTVIVELKARFDEARNIEWAKNLERSSVQVLYGVKGLKTHAKVCIIVRREPHGIQRYVHFGTGNYNELTARLYSDISYMTRNDDLGADASAFFNAITGYSQPQQFQRIEAAPIGLRDRLLEMIEIETQRKIAGQKAHIVAKVNSLVDTRTIDALYNASRAGVAIKLNVRGICCLRPGVPGLSENIQVVSIVDRFLEHSRVFYFFHGGDERVFISSADWMPRNLDRRVELLVPVDDPACRRKLISILDTYFRDNVKARKLLSDGSYQLLKPAAKEKPVRSQELFYQDIVAEVHEKRRSSKMQLEPHRAPSVSD